MSIFCISRKQFIDRLFDLESLSIWAEMFCAWAALQNPAAPNDCTCQCEARVYCFPRSDAEQIRRALAGQLPGAAFDVSNPDEILISGYSTPIQKPDLRAWQTVLGESSLRNSCLILRFTLQGEFRTYKGGLSPGKTTFVFCGEPKESGLNTKAIWRLGQDESMQLVYRGAADDSEPHLLEAFDLYVINRETNPADAATYSFNVLGKKSKHILVARKDERKVMALIRQLAELPDDRGPLAFVRRAGWPLLLGLACLGAAWFVYPRAKLAAIGIAALGPHPLLSSGRIIWKKWVRVKKYHSRMLVGLGKLYSGPVDYSQIDLSQDIAPTLLKMSADVNATGAMHLCDVCITSSKSTHDGNRIYRIGDTVFAIGLLRTTESLQFFPPKPVLLASTRFTNGRRHVTQSTPRYRKVSRPDVTVRCLLTDGSPSELLALHRRHVDKLIAAGAVPVPPPSTAAATLEMMRDEHEEARKAWERSPYSWGDALHDAFKVCRKEFLAD